MELVRWASTPEGVYGALKLGNFKCYTVERPWLDNAEGVSCIPAGKYSIQFGMYNKGGYACIDLLGVPDRTLIKIHKGNAPDDFKGCIGVGKKMGWYKNQWSIMNSGDAFYELMSEFKNLRPESISIQWALNPEL